MEPVKESSVDLPFTERVQKVVDRYDQKIKDLNLTERLQQKPALQIDAALDILVEVAKEVPEKTGRALDEIKGRIQYFRGRNPEPHQ